MGWIQRVTDKIAFGKSPMWRIRRLGSRIKSSPRRLGSWLLDVIVFGGSHLRKKKKDEDS